MTMTRTRTQTTLTKLAEMGANVHGELAFLDELLEREPGDAAEFKSPPPDVHARLVARRLQLVCDRDALYATVRQFDAGIDPAGIGTLDGWKLRFGRKGLGLTALTRRYLAVR